MSIKEKIQHELWKHIKSESPIPLVVSGLPTEEMANQCCEAIKKWVEENGTKPVLTGYGQDEKGWFFQVWTPDNAGLMTEQ
jgi:hypothetical protein